MKLKLILLWSLLLLSTAGASTCLWELKYMKFIYWGEKHGMSIMHLLQRDPENPTAKVTKFSREEIIKKTVAVDSQGNLIYEKNGKPLYRDQEYVSSLLFSFIPDASCEGGVRLVAAPAEISFGGVQHSSFSNWSYGAGTFRFNPQTGQLVKMANNTGHFFTTVNQMRGVVRELNNKKVNLDEAVVELRYYDWRGDLFSSSDLEFLPQDLIDHPRASSPTELAVEVLSSGRKMGEYERSVMYSNMARSVPIKGADKKLSRKLYDHYSQYLNLLDLFEGRNEWEVWKRNENDIPRQQALNSFASLPPKEKFKQIKQFFSDSSQSLTREQRIESVTNLYKFISAQDNLPFKELSPLLKEMSKDEQKYFLSELYRFHNVMKENPRTDTHDPFNKGYYDFDEKVYSLFQELGLL